MGTLFRNSVLPNGADPSGAWQQEESFQSPVAGAAVTYTVPGGSYVLLLSVSVTLATSAALGNRQPFLSIADGNGAVVAEIVPVSTQPPGVSYFYMWDAQYSTAYNGGGSMFANPLPEWFLQPTWSVTLSNVSIQATDIYQNPFLLTVHVPSGSAAVAPADLVPTPIAL